ncbi:MAG: PKD domain-containing protein [Candidatus Methanomethylophilaceae archaeon]|nr:PKD domain-containing protein [Candidatus Methanomethylophilaceae archaeon]
MSFISVAIMVLTVFAAIVPFTDDSSATGDTWSYTITLDSNAASITSVTDGNGNNTTNLSSSSVGSWGWDANGEYGPFGSYYAGFNISTGDMDFHISAFDLTKKIDGTAFDASLYDVMWCIPTVYWKINGNSLTLTNDSTAGGVAYAHTIDGQVWPYLAIGVYESSVANNVAYSKSGESSNISNLNVLNYNTYSEAKTITNGESFQWNWFQHQLYKYCVYTVLGTMDSQSFAYGIVSGSKTATGGSNVAANGYYGTTADKTHAERIFIENAWGNVYEFLGNTFFMTDGLYVAQSSTGQTSSSGTGMNNIYSSSNGYTTGSQNYSGAVHTYNAETWGLPKTATAGTSSTGTRDYVCVSGSSNPVARVGGYYSYGLGAGVSCLVASCGTSNASAAIGSRLAFVYAGDSTASSEPVVVVKSVTLDHSVLSGVNTSGLTSTVTITEGATYPNLGTLSGYTHVGYYVNGAFVAPGAEITNTDNHTAYSIWRSPYITITYMHGNSRVGTLSVPTGTEAVVFTPELSGYVFNGWFTDSQLTSPYVPWSPLSTDITLYADAISELVFTSNPRADAIVHKLTLSSNTYYVDACQSDGRYQIKWDFGDGHTSENVIDTHTYAAAGEYTVTLTVTNFYGTQSVQTYNVTVTEDDINGFVEEHIKWFKVIGAILAIVAIAYILRRLGVI